MLTPSITVGGKLLTGVVAEAIQGMIGQYRVSAQSTCRPGRGRPPIMLEIGGKKSQDGLFVPVANPPVIAAVVNAASGVTDIVSGVVGDDLGARYVVHTSQLGGIRYYMIGCRSPSMASK